MNRMQCVLALTALYVGLVHAWDIAVSAGDKLHFFTEGTETDTVQFRSHNLTAITFDEVHNMMLYVDKQSDHDAICGYDLSNKDNRCFVKRYGGDIHSLAFDPVTELLFFTDTNDKSINWISLKSGYTNKADGNLLIKMDDRTPTDIAVDSCKGYIYWSNEVENISVYEHMERARLNGSQRQVTYRRSLHIYSLAIDPKLQKIYYLDGAFDEFLNSADLKNNNWIVYNAEDILLPLYEHASISKGLTLSKDYIYWINGTESYKTIWQRSKNAKLETEPTEIGTFFIEGPLGIAANYKIKEEIQGFCEAQPILIPTVTATNNSPNTELTNDTNTIRLDYCVHGRETYGVSRCICTPGYIGERCDVSVCENYCLQGNCSFNVDGLPECRCKPGYSGARCEVYACHGYCLNNGECSLNEEDEPVCQCVGNHEGSRCEAVKNDVLTFTNTKTYLAERNITLVDLLSNWRKPTAKISITVEV